MDSLFTGGSEYSTLLYARWMQQQGHQVKIILLKIKKPSYDPVAFGLQSKDILLLEPGGLYFKLRQLHLIIRTYQPAIVHSVLNSSNFLCRVLRILSRGFTHVESLVNQPYSEERLQDKNLKFWKIRILQLFDRFTQGRGVDAFHANSEAVALHYCREVGVPSSKLTVIPRGREINDWISARDRVREEVLQEFQFQEPCLLLLNTGRHEHQKGQDVLLQALAALPAPLNWYLLIAGREGAATKELQSQVEQLQLQRRVFFAGHRTDVPRLLAAADLFVFPSRFEGMPGALIEACAAGLPIVCTDLPCMTEVVEPDVNARLFTAEDAAGLSSQIEALLKNGQERQERGRKSLQLFESKFQLEAIHQRMEAFYQTVLMGKK